MLEDAAAVNTSGSMGSPAAAKLPAARSAASIASNVRARMALFIAPPSGPCSVCAWPGKLKQSSCEPAGALSMSGWKNRAYFSYESKKSLKQTRKSGLPPPEPPPCTTVYFIVSAPYRQYCPSAGWLEA